MKKRLCAFLTVLAAGGCVEEMQPLPARFTEVVQVSKREPGPACRPLGAIEGRSREIDRVPYESAYEVLRTNAALRGGNYVVIDLLHGANLASSNESSIVIHGRLYDCALGESLPVAHVHHHAPPPLACAAPSAAVCNHPDHAWGAVRD
jgi:hypothetical protein